MKIKSIFLSTLGIIAAVSLASCKKGETKTIPTPPPAEYDVVENNDDYDDSISYMLTNARLDLSQTRTIFYVGDDFTSEGLIVNGVFFRYVNGVRDDKTTTIEQHSYTVDSSGADMGSVGTYPIIVSFRNGDQNIELTYNIEVRTSLFETTPGNEYIAGLSVKFKGTSDVIKTIKYGTSLEIDADSFDIVRIDRKINDDLSFTDTEVPISSDDAKITVDTTGYTDEKRGTYFVYITYQNENKVIIDGKEYDNEVKSFVVINVEDLVTKIEWNSGNDEQYVGELDTSDWLIDVTRESGEVETVEFNSDEFEVTGIGIYKIGEQAAVINYKGATKNGALVTCKVSLYYDVDGDQDIYFVKDLNYGNPNFEAEDTSKEIQLDEDGYLVGMISKRAKGDKSGDGVTFSTKVTIKTSGYLNINCTSGGRMVVYVSSTSQAEPNRGFSIYDPSGEEIKSFETKDYNTADGFVIDFTEAGTYKLVPTSADVYVFGVILILE